STGASVIILNESQELKEPINSTLLRVSDPYTAFATLLSKYQEMVAQQMIGIQEPAYISKSAVLGDNIFVGAFAYIGDNVKVGSNVKVYPNVYIGNNVTIGDN